MTMSVVETSVSKELRGYHEQLQAQTPYDFVGLESRAVLNYISSAVHSVSDNFGAFINNFKNSIGGDQKLSAPFAAISPTELKAAVAALEPIPYSSMARYVIRCPEGVAGAMVPYLKALQTILLRLHDVDARVLVPLNRWVGQVLANPKHAEKAWAPDGFISPAEMDKLVKPLEKHFVERYGSDVVMRPVHKVYPKKEDFEEAGEILIGLTDIVSAIMSKDLLGKAEEIAKNVKRLVELNDERDILENAQKRTLATMSMAIYDAARELEVISVLVFQVKVAITAYEETLKKINLELK